MHALPETLSAGYRIIREIGRGGMATVFLAEDRKHHRQVAVKVLAPELAAAVDGERFSREIELLAGLQHPHVVPLFDSGDADGVRYYIMPFIEGESLRSRLERERSLSVSETLAIAADVASALTAAHSRGIVHRDIKPENILLSGGEALVADFGIALAVARTDSSRLTAAGLSVGTPAYMSPEQVGGDQPIDARSDQYALACVMFEMLTGAPPFEAPTAQATFARALTEAAPRVRARRNDVPPSIDAALARALEKGPDERFPSIAAFIDACTPATIGTRGLPTRTRWIAGVGVLGVVGALGWPLWSSWQLAEARAQLPRIAALVDRGQFVEAYDAARGVEARLTGDSAFQSVMARTSDILTITSTPAGARVYIESLPAGDSRGQRVARDSVLLGVTPLRAVRVPRVDHRVHLLLAGYRDAERIASSARSRSIAAQGAGRDITVDVPLSRDDALPAEMVAIPGGRYQLVGPGLPIGLSTELRDFFLDRFEVSTAEYLAFVRRGGYTTEVLWPTTSDRSRFVDRTGLPGPRDWRNQNFPEGVARHPVTGVTWFEARAYCAWLGKRLPTLFEWEKASRNGDVTPTGLLLPWGFVTATTGMERRANFASQGTVAVDALPFGVSPYGVHALVGNVKEWLANPVEDGRAVAGGSWQDPAYVYSEVATPPETTATATLGFRCARNAVRSDRVAGDERLVLRPAPPVYRPVSAEGIRALQAFYRYDKRPHRARVVEEHDGADWRRQRIWMDGIGDDSVLAYLYLPKSAAPPFQTLIYVPSSDAFFFRRVWESIEQELLPQLKAGRAVFAVVMRGMLERPNPPGTARPAPSSVAFRDEMVRNATDLRMGVDYLETRPDIDRSRLAYFGFSWGAGSRLVFAGVDDRWRAVVLVGAGIDERVQPTLPEASNFNFAAHLRQPKLVVNGRQDEEHPWASRAKPLWDVLPEPKELVLIDGAGHHPPIELRAPPINAFLTKVLGPVTPAR